MNASLDFFGQRHGVISIIFLSIYFYRMKIYFTYSNWWSNRSPLLKHCILFHLFIFCFSSSQWVMGFPGGSVVKNTPALHEMQVSWVPSLAREDALEKGVEVPSSILAGKTPRTGLHHGMQFRGSQRVRSD